VKKMKRANVAFGVALVVVGIGASAQAQTIKRAPAFAGADLVTAPTQDWATNGGDWYNRRYSPLAAINRGNVAQLKGVWRTHLRGSGLGPQYSGEAQPLVYRGVIYVVTGANDVFAVGVDSGEILWDYRANLDASNSAVCCGWTSRGVALGDGKVYVGQLDGKLVALDQKTGKVAWSVQAERWQDGLSITPGGAAGPIRVTTTFRVQPGEQPLFTDFLRGDVLPFMQQAKAAGKITGYGVSNAAQGSPEQGLRIMTTYFANLAAYDAANANGGLAEQTVGAARAAQLGAKQAHLGQAVRVVIRRRVADLSY